MKAIVLKETGAVENLMVTETPKPEIQAHEVLVRVKAIGINPVDAFVRQHRDALDHFVRPVPDEQIILGWDISGVVEAAGDQVTKWAPGDEVFGMVNFPGHGRGYAEYVAAPAGQLAAKPANISHEEAAAANLAALTAWQALVTYGKVQPGEKVLIHAAGGGVGHYAVQIAKHLGAFVIGTGSANKKDFILELGADEFIDHTAVRFEDRVQDADFVLDSRFGDHVFRSLDALKVGGRIVTLLAFFDNEELIRKVEEKKIRTHRLDVVSSGNDMEAIAALLESGRLVSYISARFPFEDMSEAHTAIGSGNTLGKIVVFIS